MSRFFFKAFVQLVLLFGADTWVVTPHMGWVLGGFQYQVARRLRGRLPLRRLEGRWGYTLAEVTRDNEGFDLMETYIWQRQNTFVHYIVM